MSVEYIDKECEYCHKKYKITKKARKKLKYCSATCRRNAQLANGYDVACRVCGKVFHTTKSADAKCCSVKCYAIWQRGEEHQKLYKQTLLEKYNVTRTIDIPGCREKKENTSLKHFGVKHPLQSKEVQDKRRKTCEDVYGDAYPQRLPHIKEKAQKTCLEKYGATTVLGSKEFRDVLKSKMLTTYVVEHPSQLKLSDKARQAFASKEALTAFINSHEDKTAVFLYTELSVDDTTFYDYLDKYNLRNLVTHSASLAEREIKSLFPTINFIKDRTILNGQEIDLYAPDYKIGIEFNGNYWHSDAKKDKNYHYNKSTLAAEKGVLLFHIFEYEWKDTRKKQNIINRLNTLFKLNTNRVFARKCLIKTVSSKEARIFYNDNHVQGFCAAQIHLGLVYGDDLVAMMSFKTNGINKNIEWELCRFACKSGYIIAGGASKLLKHFVTTYKPSSIISYSDIAKTRGLLYQTLGFVKTNITHPQYVWTTGGNTILTRHQTQLKQLIKLHWKSEKDNLTEDQVMRAHKYYKIYDCGKCVWVWKTNK